MNAPLPRRRAGAALLLASLAAAVPAQAQLVYTGFGRIDQSDATFVSITSADMLGLESVPVRSYSCTVAWGVRIKGAEAGEALAAGTLTGAAAGGAPIRADVQQDLHALLYGRGSGVRIVAGLAPTGSSRRAEAAAVTLVRRLEGLLAAAERMNPARPGVAAPTRLSAAIAAFDDYLDASSTAFLAEPSDALLGVHAVLTRMVNGGVENDGRVETAAVPGGLACAAVMGEEDITPLDDSTREEPRPFDMCTVQESGPVKIFGQITPSGDSLAFVQGTELRLRDAYPAPVSVTEFAWYHSGAELRLGRDRYVKFGSTRELLPGSVALFARYEGVNVYAAPGLPRPTIVFLPVNGCVFQGYTSASSSSNARG
jgi:hypothetical protein